MKNDVINAIMDRRSIRNYKREQITQQELDAILDTALQSPSARNFMPWQVRVVQDAVLLAEMNEDYKKVVSTNPAMASMASDPDLSFYYYAPTVIFIYGDKNKPYHQVDAGIFVENIALAAQSLNIGSVIIGIVSMMLKGDQAEKWIEKLKIPDNHDFVIACALGYKNESPEAKPRMKSRIQMI